MSFFSKRNRFFHHCATTLFLCAATPAVVAVSASIAHAQESLLPSASLPKGSKRFTDGDKGFTGILTDVTQVDGVKRKAQGDAITYIWQGNAYEEDRVKFTKAALRRALTGAGYEVQDVPDYELGGVNIFAHFDGDDAPFKPSLVKQTSYFLADNPTKKQSLVGLWVESGDALALSLMSTAFVAKPGPATLPDAPDGAVVVNGTDATKQVAVSKAPTFTKLAPKPRAVRGQVRDSAGKPLAGVEVAVHASAGGGFRTTHKGRSNAQGIYEVLVPAGVAEVVEVKYNHKFNGQTFGLKLTPELGHAQQFDSKVGHVENYYLKTGGTSGGTIRVLHGLSKGIVEITLKPTGPLMMGGAARTFVFRYDVAENGQENYLHGVPIGRYQLTARLFDRDDALPLRASHASGARKLVDTLPLDFEAGYTYTSWQSGKGNDAVQHFEVVLEP